MNSSDITIAIPVYERTEYFIEALKSAVNQTIPCKILVIDNNSSHDDFLAIIKNYPLADITFVKNEENLGMMGNWNKCIQLCPTKYITILHDDDLLHPDFIKIIEATENWDVLFTKSVVNEIVEDSFFNELKPNNKKLVPVNANAFAFGNFNYVPGTIFSISAAKNAGLFTADYGYVLDFHFWLKLSIANKAYYLDQPVSFYRLSPLQATNALFKNMVLNTYNLLQLVPAFAQSEFINSLSSFRTYCGGMDLYLKSGIAIDQLTIEFHDNPTFIKDHKRFNWIYKIGFLRRTILFSLNKFINYNLRYQLL